jgi:CDP-glucose 4,6-dehydratase
MGLNSSINAEFWRGKRVFLTGHTGFKGSWLSLWLQMLETELTGFALSPPTSPSLFKEANVTKGMNSIEGDIRDLNHLQESMETARPEIVVHMAAQPLVRYSYQNPVETYATNVMGTVNVLEAVRNTSGVLCAVNVTTDKCYENKELDRPYQEEDPMGGHDPYSSSKGCAELVSAAYRSSFFNPKDYSKHGVALATARAGNVIGGGDWAENRLIPDIIKAFEKGQIAQIRNPHAIRPWQHVLEPLRGYLVLAERLTQEGAEYAEGWNFGPKNEDAKPVEWIVEQMASRWGDSARWESDPGEHPHEAGLLKLDVSKARDRLGWEPCLALNDALNLVIDWAQKHSQGADMRTFTQTQILTYQNLG